MPDTVPETVTVSLDDSLCGDSPSSHESDWTDVTSETASTMSGDPDKFEGKSTGGRRVHFDGGRDSSKRSRSNRDRDYSPRPAPAATTTAPTGNSSGQQTTRNQAPPANQPTVPVFNNPAPVPTAGQQVFIHHTGTFNPYPHGQPVQPTSFINYPGQPYPNNPSGTIPGFGQPTFIAAAPVAMSGYVNPPNTGIHFQPQVPDTTNGPYLHTYHPRHDQAQTYYVPAVGANVYLPPIIQQPVMQPIFQQHHHQQQQQQQQQQQPAVIQQPVIYQAQVPAPAPVCPCMQYHASGASSYLSLTLELQAAAKWSSLPNLPAWTPSTSILVFQTEPLSVDFNGKEVKA